MKIENLFSLRSPVKLLLIFTTFDFKGSEQAPSEIYYTDVQQT